MHSFCSFNIQLNCVTISATPEAKAPPQEVKQELKRSRKSTTQKSEESRVLFKFEYEGDDGEVRCILVKEVQFVIVMAIKIMVDNDGDSGNDGNLSTDGIYDISCDADCRKRM